MKKLLLLSLLIPLAHSVELRGLSDDEKKETACTVASAVAGAGLLTAGRYLTHAYQQCKIKNTDDLSKYNWFYSQKHQLRDAIIAIATIGGAAMLGRYIYRNTPSSQFDQAKKLLNKINSALLKISKQENPTRSASIDGQACLCDQDCLKNLCKTSANSNYEEVCNTYLYGHCSLVKTFNLLQRYHQGLIKAAHLLDNAHRSDELAGECDIMLAEIDRRQQGIEETMLQLKANPEWLNQVNSYNLAKREISISLS